MKRQIDYYIETNYEELLEIVKRKLQYFKSNLCPNSLISDAYLYVMDNPPEEERMISAYIINYINTEIKYSRSNTNRRDLLNSVEIADYIDEEDIFEDIDFRLFTEEFVKKLDRVDQIVWRVMVEKGLIKVRELSEHFNIPETTIYLYRVRITEQFKAYYEDKKRIQGINSNDQP